MTRLFCACSAHGIPILCYGAIEQAEWKNIGRLAATIGGMLSMDAYKFESHGRSFTVKPFLTSYHKFFCIVVDDEVRADDSNTLTAYMIGNAVDRWLRDTFATVLTYLEQKSDAEMNASTFSNRNNGDGIDIEECMNVLFPCGLEKDNFLLFEEHYIRQALADTESNVPFVASLFAPLSTCPAASEVYLLEHTGDLENVSDFISAAEQSKVRLQPLYASYLHSPASCASSSRRKLVLGEFSAGLAEAYVRSYLGGRASAQGGEGGGEGDGAAVGSDQSTRVACFLDGSSLIMCSATAKLVLLARLAPGVVAACPTSSTGAEVSIRLGDALPGDIRAALARCCAGLAAAFPSCDASQAASGAPLSQEVIAALFAGGER